MIVCIFKNPDPSDPKRKGVDIEMRVVLEGMTDEESEVFGEAINEFAIRMGRRATLNAFQVDKELLAH